MALVDVKVPERKTQRLSFRADPDTCMKLDAIAKALNMRKSDIVRQWIDDAYAELKLDKSK